MDRIDIHVEVVPVSHEELASSSKGERSKSIRERVMEARDVQRKRFQSISGTFCNAQMNSNLVGSFCTITREGQGLLKLAMERLG